jgi:DNA-binding response OmpR family regulator
MLFLVDDDTDDIELVHEALTRQAYQGEVAALSNGQELMQKLKGSITTNLPRAIVLDLNMPLKDGFEVLEEMRGERRLAEIPVIILTASSNHRDKIRCHELGCKLYLQKPATVEEYDKLVALILAQIRERTS